MSRTPEKRKIRGLEARQEVEKGRLCRDVRPIHVQVLEPFKSAEAQSLVIVALAVTGFIVPGILIPSCLLACLLTLGRMNAMRKDRLSWRIPKSTGLKRDPGNRKPGGRKYNQAEGLYYIGNDYKTGEELWLSAEDILEHILNMGTTGSGKTEFLVGLSFNALATASGFIYVDPKGAPKLAMQIYHICRMLGRDDDFLLLNFRTGGRDIKANARNLSNNTNPFAFGSSDALTQMLISLMPQEKGRNSIFQANAQTLVTALMRGLVELRDAGKLTFSIDTIREHFILENYVALSKRADLSAETKKGLQSALATVGYRREKPMEEQTQAFYEQYGYAAAYFGLTITSFTNTYGHIYRTSLGEVDMYDVIKNRRILTVILPSVEKAPQALENLGKVILSAIRKACAVGLGNRIVGKVDDVLDSLPINSMTPMLSITDEYAAIATPGYSQIFTQGRGLGVAGVVSSQDYPGIKATDEVGAKQIISNTKVKLAMKLQDPDETWELFRKIASTGRIMQTTGYEVRRNSTLGTYRDKMAVTSEKMDRINWLDLQNQIQGEFHGFFEGTIVRADCFYTDIDLQPDAQLRLNIGLEVMPPVELDCYEAVMSHLADDWFKPLELEDSDEYFEICVEEY